MKYPGFNNKKIDEAYKRYKHEEIHKVLCEIYVVRAVAIAFQYEIKTMERIEALYKAIECIHNWDYPYIS